MQSLGGELKRRDIGLVGAIIMLAQVLSSFQSNRNLSKEIDQLKTEFHVVRTEQNKYFVKKKELHKVIVKLDSMTVQLAGIRNQLKSIRALSMNDEENIIGCTFKTFEDRSSLQGWL